MNKCILQVSSITERNGAFLLHFMRSSVLLLSNSISPRVRLKFTSAFSFPSLFNSSRTVFAVVFFRSSSIMISQWALSPVSTEIPYSPTVISFCTSSPERYFCSSSIGIKDKFPSLSILTSLGIAIAPHQPSAVV